MECVLRSVCRVLVGKPEEKRVLGRLKCRWKYNNNVVLQDMFALFDWINLAKDMNRWRALENVVIKFWVVKKQEISRLAEVIK